MRPSISAIAKAAEQIVRERLANRSGISVPELVRNANISAKNRSAAERILQKLGDDANLDVEKLRPNDQLSKLFRVAKADIGIATSPAWERHNFGEYIETFSDDILHAVDSLSTRESWTLAWTRRGNVPANEDDTLDAIMEMTVEEFLTFFAPTVRPE